MPTIQTALAQYRPWQRCGLALLAGVGVTLAMPPLYALPVLFISLPLFALLIEASPTVRSRLALGWWFGAGYMVSSLYWVANALEIVGASPILAMALPLSMAGYYAVLAVLYGGLATRSSNRVVVFAFCWMIAEGLRGTLFTGFPWNLLAHAWAFSDITIQTASVFVFFCLSSVTALMAASPLAMLGRPLRTPASWLPMLGTALVLAVMVVFGVVQLRPDLNPPPTDKRVRIVQANIPQREKWASTSAAKILFATWYCRKSGMARTSTC